MRNVQVVMPAYKYVLNNVYHNTIDGFWYPIVDNKKCIECGRCLKACLAFNKFNNRTPLKCYAGYNKNEKIRLKSSSGGIFFELAKLTINNGGIVFGAVFDKNWNVTHVSAKSIDEVQQMLGSKYVQSNTLDTYKECKTYLNEGKEVLYSGTPCQIGGLHKFLGKNYNNLFTVDLICHGAPSPGVWQRYLKETFSPKTMIFQAKMPKNTSPDISSFIRSIKFRDKTYGWEKFSFVVNSKLISKRGSNMILLSHIYSKNPYMKGFLNDLFLRESCYNCPSRKLSSQSDITIGDFWGVHKLNMDDMNDHKGLSIITINTTKGNVIFKEISSNFVIRELSYAQAVESNSNLIQIANKNTKKVNKFKKFEHKMLLSQAIEKTLHINIIKKIIIKIKYKLRIIK